MNWFLTIPFFVSTPMCSALSAASITTDFYPVCKMGGDVKSGTGPENITTAKPKRLPCLWAMYHGFLFWDGIHTQKA